MTPTSDLRRPLPSWTPRPPLGPEPMQGRLCQLEPLSAERHGPALYAENAGDEPMWEYMSCGPFASEEEYLGWVRSVEGRPDPEFYAILDAAGRPRGVASFMRIDQANGVCEVGNIALSPGLQRRGEATEAMYLMAERAFSRGYRRYEWKCNAANLPSRRAAERLGFSYEGTFRNHMVMKGRSRDTAWFAMTDDDWALIGAAQRRWLDPSNFDAAGQQKLSLSDLTAPLLKARDPLRASA